MLLSILVSRLILCYTVLGQTTDRLDLNCYACSYNYHPTANDDCVRDAKAMNNSIWCASSDRKCFELRQYDKGNLTTTAKNRKNVEKILKWRSFYSKRLHSNVFAWVRSADTRRWLLRRHLLRNVSIQLRIKPLQ